MTISPPWLGGLQNLACIRPRQIDFLFSRTWKKSNALGHVKLISCLADHEKKSNALGHVKLISCLAEHGKKSNARCAKSFYFRKKGAMRYHLFLDL